MQTESAWSLGDSWLRGAGRLDRTDRLGGDRLGGDRLGGHGLPQPRHREYDGEPQGCCGRQQQNHAEQAVQPGLVGAELDARRAAGNDK